MFCESVCDPEESGSALHGENDRPRSDPIAQKKGLKEENSSLRRCPVGKTQL
ncbi:uncharacterized, partial [Tachysurus ichikawai]